jgi:hypothetical protein
VVNLNHVAFFDGVNIGTQRIQIQFPGFINDPTRVIPITGTEATKLAEILKDRGLKP